MNKIPLERTLVGAYRFLFTKIISIVGTLWLPIVVFCALIGGLVWFSVPHEWFTGHFPQFNDKHPDPAAVLAVLRPLLICYPLIIVIALVMASMMFVGLMRHALGQKKTMTFIYFSLGADVWRLLLAFILLYVVLIVLAIALVAVFILVSVFAAPMVPHGQALAIKIVLGIVECLFFFYAVFRLFFFLPAVVVAEKRIGLGRAWSLGGGNFWRIFLTILLIVIPIGFVAAIVMQMTVMPAFMSLALTMPHDPKPEHIAAVFRTMFSVMPAIFVIGIIQRIITMGLMAGAMGTAYNAVTEAPAVPDVPAAPEGPELPAATAEGTASV